MASPGSPELNFSNSDASALNNGIVCPPFEKSAVPTAEGNHILAANDLAKAGSVDALPKVNFAESNSDSNDLGHAALTIAATEGTGAVIGAAAFAGAGKALGHFAEIFMHSPSGVMSISNQLALGAAEIGAVRGGLIGLAVGAVTVGAYEIAKYSGEHPDQAPDLSVVN